MSALVIDGRTAQLRIPPRRARRMHDDTADCRVWDLDAHWRIQERRSRYFMRSRHRRKIDYLLERRHPQWGGWDIVSRHRSLDAAMEAWQEASPSSSKVRSTRPTPGNRDSITPG
jgi:hypothetical protein